MQLLVRFCVVCRIEPEFFRVWSFAGSPQRTNHPAYFGLATVYFSQPFLSQWSCEDYHKACKQVFPRCPVTAFDAISGRLLITSVAFLAGGLSRITLRYSTVSIYHRPCGPFRALQLLWYVCHQHPLACGCRMPQFPLQSWGLDTFHTMLG